MSVKTMGRVWDHCAQKGSGRLLMLALADRADHSGVCWPGRGSLSSMVGVEPRQISRLIATAVEVGEVVSVPAHTSSGRQTSNRYLVAVGLSSDEVYQTLITHEQLQMPAEDARAAVEQLEKARGGPCHTGQGRHTGQGVLVTQDKDDLVTDDKPRTVRGTVTRTVVARATNPAPTHHNTPSPSPVKAKQPPHNARKEAYQEVVTGRGLQTNFRRAKPVLDELEQLAATPEEVRAAVTRALDALGWQRGAYYFEKVPDAVRSYRTTLAAQQNTATVGGMRVWQPERRAS